MIFFAFFILEHAGEVCIIILIRKGYKYKKLYITHTPALYWIAFVPFETKTRNELDLNTIGWFHTINMS